MKKLFFSSLFCTLSIFGYANEAKTLTTKSIVKVQKIYSFKNFKLSCVIYTTIRTIDENRNVIDERTVRTEGSGLSCVGSDSDGIVRNVRTVRVEGIHP